jgi:hypothetical protein
MISGIYDKYSHYEHDNAGHTGSCIEAGFIDPDLGPTDDHHCQGDPYEYEDISQ